MRDGTEEGIVQVNEDDLLLENVCWVSEKKGKKKAVIGVYEYEEEEAIGAR